MTVCEKNWSWSNETDCTEVKWAAPAKKRQSAYISMHRHPQRLLSRQIDTPGENYGCPTTKTDWTT